MSVHQIIPASITAATWRWNVNTILLSGSSLICLHPSTRLNPPLPYTDFPYHFFYSKSHILKIAQGLPVTFLLRRMLYLLPTWNYCCISIRFIPLLNLSLCVHYVALLVFHCMEQSGCASICRPLLQNSIVCTFVSATDYNGCTCRGKAPQSSKSVSDITVKLRCGRRDDMCRSAH